MGNNMKMDQETLASVLRNHELWLKSQGARGERADLSEKDLRGANLSLEDLSYADLSKADLRGANLWGSNLMVQI